MEPPKAATFTVRARTLEDFLATDDLFVEYFNSYLALPSFPEPLCFNKETGGFEVVSDARQELAQQIKAAIRSQRRTPRMYRVAKQHAFIDIPLIPIVPPEGPEKMEIDTSFSVTTLNKEQGIHWVKAERLPTFLQSDCYFEYRLGNVLSQVRLMDSRGQFVLMKIDYKPRAKKSKKKQDEVKVDLKDVYMKDMYVCMGEADTTNTDAWFSQAKVAHSTEPTYISLSRPVSASRPIGSSSSGRPASAFSTTRGSQFRPDSGIGSPLKSSVFSSPYFGSYDTLGVPVDDVLQSRLYGSSGAVQKPITPRPGEPVCATDLDSAENINASTVYASPKVESVADTESGVGDVGDFDRDEIIVGAVMKKAMADVAKIEQEALEKDPRIAKVFPDHKYTHISTDMLDNVVAIVAPPEPTAQQEEKKDKDDTTKKDDESAEKKPKESKADEESDVDSLLDSEEDYEEEDRKFFRRHKKPRSYNLQSKKGIAQFKRFLKGTAGENLWQLWLDIDKLVLVTSEEDQALYLSGMREKYHKHGAPYEISLETKVSLGLTEPSQWTVSRLQAVQSRVAEPLVLYWAPRFLLKHLLHTNPNKYYQYQQQMNMKPPPEVYPNPPTMTLLPLRPKSCLPRAQHQIIVEDFFEQPCSVSEEPLEPTTPRVGMRRIHGPSAILPPPAPKTPTSRPSSVPARKKPRELLTAHLKAHDRKMARMERNGSAAVASKQSSAKSRPKSSKPPSSVPASRSRPKSPGSESADSWDAASALSIDRGRASSGGTGSAGRRSRPTTAPSQRKGSASSSSATVSTQFEGGRRMEALLQALYHEKDSGHFFRNFLKRTNNKRWLDAAQFWEDVQSYRMLFYQDAMDPYVVQKRAQAIFSQYVVMGAPRDVGCSPEARQEVYKCLDPPQEELFDVAEEEALGILYMAWMSGLTSDMHTYNKVELIEVKRHLETKSKYVMNLQRSGLIKERPLTPDEPMDGYEDPVYDPAAWEAVPEEFRDYTLEKLVHNRLELEHFKQFLAEKYADTDLKCWMDVEAWRRIPPAEERKRDQKAKDIKKSYLNKKYFFGPNSPAGKEGQDKVMQAGGGWGKLLEDRPPNAVLLEAQKYVRDRLEQKWLPLFLATETFAERQRPKTSMDDVVDDVLVQKRRRSQAVWKMLESRWVSSSKEILTFRKALMNPVTSHQFRRFVSIKGDNLENDVLFWQEVQKYKQMHHVHTEDSMLSQKITAIINCFIDSQIPPSLQVDLPQEMAERVLDRKYEKSPYLFREAQLTVFRILFSHWNDFCELRMNLGQDKVLPTIERLRRHAKAKERKKQQEMERKAEEERLREGGITPGGGDGIFHDPFADHESQEGEDGKDNKKIEFSYASYMNELTKEEILNNTDESIFSSLADTGTFWCFIEEGGEKGE
ncbi:hypothetical protein BaRGS_00006551 [Batillaria attramentaria]|uniref:RGS domain-containing protein n=1 Tax=Batillaria attramentaria TaxID=370345 RepID=A0ABD0LRX6_9CAEN